VQDTYTAALCVAATGTVGCNNPPGGTVQCTIAGQCVQGLTAVQCTANGGTVGCGSGGSGSCTIPGQACFEGNSNECDVTDGEVFASGGTCNLTMFPYCIDDDFNCFQATTANKAACFAIDGILITSGLANEYCETFGGTSSSSSGGGTTPSSSSGGPVAYCDFGLPHTDGGGCFPIYTANDFGTCDTDYAITAVRCGTQTQTFCRWATGCWETTSASACTNDYGTSVTECSPSEYQHPMYCLDPNANGGPTCSRIAAGSWYTGARACLSNVGSSAAIVERSFCENAEVTIRD
jgi:hypothetical protein